MIIDQHNALTSLYDSLEPGSALVDSRTTIDKLSFLTRFAELINFYDQYNNVKGNWAPFLLKDPVFLLAHMANTPVAGMRSRFMHSVAGFQHLINQHSDTDQSKDFTAQQRVVNEIMRQLSEAFYLLGQWSFYMQRSEEYPLKKYVLDEIKKVWAPLFRAIETMARDKKYYFPSAFALFTNKDFVFADDFIWKHYQDTAPYWQTLGLTNKDFLQDSNTGKWKEVVTALSQTGEKLIDFLSAITEEARHEFVQVQKIKSRYPDTTLLRTFINLSDIHQAAMNQLAAKHLQFYYKDVLHQQPLPATPDKVFVYATLTGNKVTYKLPAATLFNAGVDEAGKPVTFSLEKDTVLNPAAITSAFTITRQSLQNAPNVSNHLYINQVPDPVTIKVDANGMVQPWNTFGTIDQAGEAAALQTAFVMASPMLLLNEGERSIRLTIEFDAVVPLDVLTSANFFFSTGSAWQQNTPRSVSYALVNNVEDQSTVIIDFHLSVAFPAVTAFPGNPENLNSPWPMLKIGLNTYGDLAKPPLVNACTIAVSVTGFTGFNLYNDYGAINIKAPYPLLGPMPLLNSSFFISSAEIFSKPVYGFFLEYDWDKLPDDFAQYYLAYNEYVERQKHAESILDQLRKAQQKAKHRRFWGKVGHVLKKSVSPVVSAAKSIWKGASDAFKWVFSIKKYPPPLPHSPYNNTCFTVAFDFLNQNGWVNLPINKVILTGNADGSITVSDYIPDKECSVLSEVPSLSLFTPVWNGKSQCVPGNQTFFGLGSLKIDFTQPDNTVVPDNYPVLQSLPLSNPMPPAYGMMRMQLTGPVHGFGSSLYANVVADIALRNAALIVEKAPPDSLLPLANAPFVPKLSQMKGSYSAVYRYDWTTGNNPYPGNCFLYVPLQTEVVYSKTTGIAGTGNMETNHAGAIPLYPSFPFSGVLYIQVQHLVLPADIHLYFQLSRSYGNIGAKDKACFFYSCNDSWSPLELVSDGTNNFSCSGIITLSFKNQSTVTSQTSCWIAIGVNGDVSAYASVVLLQTNGCLLQRAGNDYAASLQAPALLPGTITQTTLPFPGIASVVQPFASFGGRAAETEIMMNRRVCNRIATKDRAVSKQDYVRLISQYYSEVYYAKLMYDELSEKIRLYVAKKVSDITDANAFMPLVTECTETSIQDFLSTRVNAFTTVEVSNFSPELVQVVTAVIPERGVDVGTLSRDLNTAICLFLSPWIETTQQQLVIDTGISSAALSSFISTVKGVASVAGVSLNRGDKIIPTTSVVTNTSFTGEAEMIFPATPGSLFITVPQHIIQCISE